MTHKHLIRAVAGAGLLVVALSGCSTMKGWFAGKDSAAKKAAEPAELVDFEATVKPRRVWSANLGEGEGRIGARQRPAVAAGSGNRLGR